MNIRGSTQSICERAKLLKDEFLVASMDKIAPTSLYILCGDNREHREVHQ